MRTAGRVGLWAFLALVVARGIGDILADEPTPVVEAPAEAGSAFPDTEAQAFAASFARAYLTWQPGEPEVLRRELAAYTAPDLVEQLVAELPRKGEPQAVAETSVARTQSLGADRGLVTVACALTGRVEEVRYLAVSVARGSSGGLAVDAPPALVARPPLAHIPASTGDLEIAGSEAAEIEALARDFLAAYLTGASASEMERLLAPGARIVPAGLDAAAVEIRGVFELGAPSGRERSVTVDARVQSEEGGATYPLRYRLALVRTDRWYVHSIAGGPA